MRVSAAAWLIALALPGAALAQPVADAPAVPVEDLPPLPPSTDEDDANATLRAAVDVDEDIVVGAAKREQALGNVASAVTVISRDRLRRFGYRTIAEALQGVAGFFVVSDRITPRIGTRGQQPLGDFNTRLLVLVDGATVNEPWGAYVGLGYDVPLSIDDVARIEVIRGPVSSVYGTNAFYGIINIVTRSATESEPVWGRLSASSITAQQADAGFAVGNVNRQLRGSVFAQLRQGEVLSVPGIGNDIDSDGMQAVSASLVGAWGGAFAQVRFYRRARNVPWSPYDTEVGTDKYIQYDTLLMAEGGYTKELSSKLSVTGRAYVSRYRFNDDLNYQGDPNPFYTFGDAFWLGGEARTRYAILDGNRLGVTAGAEVVVNQTDSVAFVEGMEANGTDVPHDFNMQGIYAELDGQPTPWLGFTAGVRGDRNSKLDSRVSPRAALFLSRADRAGVKLLYAEGFRNPSAFEGFFDDDMNFAGNPDIGAERIRSYEAVLWGKPKPGLSLRLSGFHWKSFALLKQVPIIENGNTVLQFQNVGDQVSTGVELEGSYRSPRGWVGFAGGAYSRVTDSTGEDVANAPAVTGALGVSTPALFGLGNLSAETTFVSARATRDPAVRADPFVGVNLHASLPDLGGFDLGVGVRNLIGKREQLPAQEDYDRTTPTPVLVPIVPGEGRELYVRLGYALD